MRASLVAANSYNATQSIEDQLRVVAYLKQPSDPAKNTELLEKLEKTDHIENVVYVSKGRSAELAGCADAGF